MALEMGVILVRLVVYRYDPSLSDGHGDIAIGHGKGIVARLRDYGVSGGCKWGDADIPVTLGTSAYRPLGLAIKGLLSSVASSNTIPFFPSFDSWAEAVLRPE